MAKLKKADLEGRSIRDIVKEQKLVGMTSNEVRSLLLVKNLGSCEECGLVRSLKELTDAPDADPDSERTITVCA